jgi:hypothetical protein
MEAVMAVSDTPPLSRWTGGLEGKGWRTVADERHDDPTGPAGADGVTGDTCPYCGDGPQCVGTVNHIECVAALEAENAELTARAETAEATIAILRAHVDDGTELCGACHQAVVDFDLQRRTGGE